MGTSSRRMDIFNLLQKNKAVEVSELARLFNVSTMTIRRDLEMLEKQGLVTKNYGGAQLNQGAAIEPSFTLKQKTQMNCKSAIAKEAARFVQDGDSILIDCGTTTLQLCRFIQDKRITVITNSWPAVSYLQANPKIKLILAPGIYSSTSNGVISAMTIDFFHQFQADKVFVGSQGFDLKEGATVPDMEDCQVKRALIKSGRKKFLMIDHEKFNTHYLCRHAAAGEFDVIITDNQLDAALRAEAEALKLPLILAKD